MVAHAEVDQQGGEQHLLMYDRALSMNGYHFRAVGLGTCRFSRFFTACETPLIVPPPNVLSCVKNKNPLNSAP